jgi:hypothetical protein
MSNRLNFSSIDDAWGLPPENLHEEPLNKKFNYQKPKENIMTISSNEITKPMKQEFKPVQETYTDYIKPCTLVDDHIKNCELCRNKLLASLENTRNTRNTRNTSNMNNVSEHMTSNMFDDSRKYLAKTQEMYNNFDINENFENISPSQKNLIIVVLYGFLIILISDLIIKEET